MVTGCAALSGLAGCAADEQESAPSTPAAEKAPAVVKEEVVSGWTLDVAKLDIIPEIQAPAARFPFEQLSAERVSSDLLRQDSPLVRVGEMKSRARYENNEYSIEVDAVKGTVLAVRKEARSEAGNVDEAELQKDALLRLADFGIPEEEIEGAVTKRLLGQDDTRDTKAIAPRLVAYKTFITRGLGGVRVAGHRAVVTHSPDGSLRKVLMKWPALNEYGHKLRVPVSLGEVKERVASRLTETGRAPSRAALSWTQEANVDAQGRVALTLKVAAVLPAKDHGEVVEEPEIETIDIGAVE